MNNSYIHLDILSLLNKSSSIQSEHSYIIIPGSGEMYNNSSILFTFFIVEDTKLFNSIEFILLDLWVCVLIIMKTTHQCGLLKTVFDNVPKLFQNFYSLQIEMWPDVCVCRIGMFDSARIDFAVRNCV